MPSWDQVATAAASLRRDVAAVCRQRKLAAVDRRLEAAEAAVLAPLAKDAAEFKRRFKARPRWQAWVFCGWDADKRKMFGKVFDGRSTADETLAEAQTMYPVVQILPVGVEPQ